MSLHDPTRETDRPRGAAAPLHARVRGAAGAVDMAPAAAAGTPERGETEAQDPSRAVGDRRLADCGGRDARRHRRTHCFTVWKDHFPPLPWTMTHRSTGALVSSVVGS